MRKLRVPYSLGQVSELARMVKDLQRQRISTDREIKVQRAWVEGELEERAMAAQVQQAEGRVGALEVGLAAQVQRAEESMATVGQVEARMGILEEDVVDLEFDVRRRIVSLEDNLEQAEQEQDEGEWMAEQRAAGVVFFHGRETR